MSGRAAEKRTVLKISFHGVRGSCPGPSQATTRYGGNNSSLLVEAPGQLPLLLDLGSGVASLGRQRHEARPFLGTALVTHLHFDHVLGLPFFEPFNQPGACVDVYGPRQPEGSLADAFAALVRPPYFPVPLRELRGQATFRELANDSFSLGAFRVTSRLVPHLGPTLGYRVECEGKVVAYVSDHQAPADLQGVSDTMLELCGGADLLIHDAQYTRSEFLAKPNWGHSPVDYAVVVATEARVRELCLFHHDPSHTDEQIDEMLQSARAWAEPAGVTVLAAAEGLTVTL